MHSNMQRIEVPLYGGKRKLISFGLYIQISCVARPSFSSTCCYLGVRDQPHQNPVTSPSLMGNQERKVVGLRILIRCGSPCFCEDYIRHLSQSIRYPIRTCMCIDTKRRSGVYLSSVASDLHSSQQNQAQKNKLRTRLCAAVSLPLNRTLHATVSLSIMQSNFESSVGHMDSRRDQQSCWVRLEILLRWT